MSTASPATQADARAGLLATLALVAVTAVWGSTFFLIRDLIERVPVADFLAVRFTIAAVVLLAIAPRSVGRLSPAVRRHGLVLGAVYGVAQLLQTAGLGYTSASVSGFITGMYVVLTPVIGAVVLRERIGPVTWVAVGLATFGLGLLSLTGFAVGLGEALTLAAAVLYAIHIVGLGRWSTAQDAIGLSVLQMGVIAAICTMGALPGGVTLPATPADWASVLWMALAAGVFALVAQTWAQAHMPAARAAIVMTLEPVFAAGFAVAFGGESLTVRMLLGGSLVLAAMLMVELVPRRTHPEGERPHLAV